MSSEENKAATTTPATAATATPSTTTEGIEDDVKDLEITNTPNGTAAKKDPNSKLGSNCMLRTHINHCTCVCTTHPSHFSSSTCCDIAIDYFFKSTPKEEQHKYAPQQITAAAPTVCISYHTCVASCRRPPHLLIMH
jgi:hypothetical protein